jgi:hypothetical protein
MIYFFKLEFFYRLGGFDWPVPSISKTGHMQYLLVDERLGLTIVAQVGI